MRVLSFGRMIKFSHSIFALPFALTSLVLAATPGGARPAQVLWILVAMLGARSAAMGFNRLADQEIDARNPRTAGRELPRGVLSRPEVWLFVVLAAAALVLAAAMLNPLCLALSPLALLIVFGYSYAKRFTALPHLVLGRALAVAPVGAWVAIREHVRVERHLDQHQRRIQHAVGQEEQCQRHGDRGEPVPERAVDDRGAEGDDDEREHVR